MTGTDNQQAAVIDPIVHLSADDPALHIADGQDLTQTPRPLRDSAQDAIRHFLMEIDDQPYTDLYDMVIAQVEEPLLAEIMRHTSGNQSKASEMLGLNRGTLRKKLRRYNIIHPSDTTTDRN